MHVVFGHVGQFEIHDLRQLVDIETACRDICRNEYGDLSFFEVIQRTRARGLALVAMNSRGG
jgi:hypothetical protein